MTRKMYKIPFCKKGYPGLPYSPWDEEFHRWAIKDYDNNPYAEDMRVYLAELLNESPYYNLEDVKNNLWKIGKRNPKMIEGQPWFIYYAAGLSDDFKDAFFKDYDPENPPYILHEAPSLNAEKPEARSFPEYVVNLFPYLYPRNQYDYNEQYDYSKEF